MKRLIIIILTLSFFLTSYSQNSKRFNVRDIKKNEIDYSIPSLGILIQKKYYTVLYNPQTQMPVYAAYRMTRDMLVKEHPRLKYFYKDKKYNTLDNNDFRNSGFDKGHLVPAGDMMFDKKAMKESFYLYNVMPQYPALNRGIWKELENEVRRLTSIYDTLYICTGQIINKNYYLTNFYVPINFYKVILIKNGSFVKAIGFLFPHYKDKEKYNNLEYYAREVDQIEHILDIDFFYQLRDDIEERVEMEVDYNFWFKSEKNK